MLPGPWHGSVVSITARGRDVLKAGGLQEGVTPRHGGLCAHPILRRSPMGVRSPSGLQGKGMGFSGRHREQRAVPRAEFCHPHGSDGVAALLS